MRKTRGKRAFLSTVLTMAILLCGTGLSVHAEEAGSARRTVRIPCGINALLTYDENGEPTGHCKAYLDKLAEVNGWEYEYVEATWPEAVEMLESGEIDLLFPTTYTPEREETMDFSTLVGGYTASGLFTRSDSGYDYENYASFNGARIAVTRDSSNEADLRDFAEAHGFTYKPVYLNTTEDKTRALERGDADMVLFNASNDFPEAVLVSVLDASPFYYTVKKGNDELLTELNRGMQQILKDDPDLVSETYTDCLTGNNTSAIALSTEERAFVDSGEEIVVGFYEDTEPLAYVDENGDSDGIYIRLLNDIREDSGLNLTLAPISRDDDWRELLENGSIDFYIGASSVIADKDPTLCSTDPLIEYENVLVTDSDCRFNELDSPTIALTYGRSYWADYLKENLGNIQIDYYTTSKDCLVAVRNGQADAALLNNVEFNYHSKNARFSNLIQWENYRFTSGTGLTAASSVDPVMLSTVNKAVGSLPSDYVDSVINDYLNLPYASANLVDRLYAARNILIASGIILLAVIAVLVAIWIVRKRQRAILAQAEAHEKHQLKILAALSRDYTAIYYANLNEDSLETVQRNEEEKTPMGDILPASPTRSDSLRQYVTDYVLPDYQESLLIFCDPQALVERLRDEPDFAVRYQVKPNDQHMDFFEMHFVDVSESEEERITVFGIRCVDETAKKEREQKQLLQDSLAAANRANVAKSDFLSRMSHDIRTPMNAVIGMTAIAEANADNPEKVKDALKKITTSSRHLLGLINDVLDMSKIESGTISLTEEDFNLSELLNSLLTIIHPQIAAHNHDLEVHIKDIKHEDVVGDSLRIQQVFVNIMSNAIKYTPDGGNIVLTVQEKPMSTPKMGCYKFIFTDNGVGMSEEYQKHIFEPFSREEDLRTSKIQGTGLGMAITRNIVQLMNGSIRVDSTPGKGTTFTVTIFLKLQEPQDADNSDLKGLSVLVVDDDGDACESVCNLLGEIGMTSESYTSGQEGVAAVERTEEAGARFDAAILDWKMPGMDGVATAKAIKHLPHEDLPIIILSAYDWTDIEDEAREAGVDAFLSKPVFKSSLVRVFRQLKGAKDEPEGNAPALQAIGENTYAGKRILVVEDNELNREIIREILTMAGLEVEEAENGKKAVEMFSSSESGYYDLIFMDVQMPMMNGYEATVALRATDHPDAKTVPIVAMTADAFVEDVEAAKNAGMNDHLSKPIEFQKLSVVLEKYLG